MDAAAILAEGRPADALDVLTEQVRKDPADPRHRIFLFQLLAVLGQWKRALNQLQVAAGLDDGAIAMAQTYREAIQAETFREAVFEGNRTPALFGEPTEWSAMLVEALRLDAVEGAGAGTDLRSQALESAPTSGGQLNGEPFAWIADADSRLGPTFEVIMGGRYLWVPVERVAKVTIEAPSDLRDMVWLPAWFTWTNGGESAALVPTRYPGSATQDDGLIQVSRKTVWLEATQDVFHGLGQRAFVTDATEVGLLDVRSIEFASAQEG